MFKRRKKRKKNKKSYSQKIRELEIERTEKRFNKPVYLIKKTNYNHRTPA